MTTRRFFRRLLYSLFLSLSAFCLRPSPTLDSCSPKKPHNKNNSNDAAAVDAALDELGVETERRDLALRGEMARGMFDTRGKVDPFDKASPIKQCAITRFPPDMFFVLRVVQLLRGMANGELREGDLAGRRLAAAAVFRSPLSRSRSQPKIKSLNPNPARSRSQTNQIAKPKPQNPDPKTQKQTNTGMGIDDFSSAAQWAPLARRTLRQEERKKEKQGGSGKKRSWRSVPFADITALAVPLQLNV